MEKEMEVIIQPGFRFYPTEEELVSFYLHKKLDHDHQQTSTAEFDRVIPVINIYDFEPWMLPRFSGEFCNGDTEQWFFFVPRQEREARGGRPNRTTGSGYWKATGSPSYVFSYNNENRVIGVKKSMVFYTGKAPSGKKTIWKMNEYKAIEEQQILLPTTTSPQSIPKLRHELSICRVYITSGSFRSFDRRPLGTAAIKAAEIMATTRDDDNDNDDNDHDDVIMGARTNAVKEMVEIRRLSVESSSSSSAAAKIEAMNNGRNDWKMPDDSEFMRSLWDY